MTLPPGQLAPDIGEHDQGDDRGRERAEDLFDLVERRPSTQPAIASAELQPAVPIVDQITKLRSRMLSRPAGTETIERIVGSIRPTKTTI